MHAIESSPEQTRTEGEAQAGSCKPKGPPSPANRGGRGALPLDTVRPCFCSHCLLSGVHHPHGKRNIGLKNGAVSFYHL